MTDLSMTYSISELSTEFHVTPRTLRFYEDQGLISPSRNGQSRIYNRKDRARIAWILRGKRVGFSLSEISDVLNLYHQKNGRLKQGQVTIKACEEKIKTLTDQKHDIDETIHELAELQKTISDWMADGTSDTSNTIINIERRLHDDL